MPGPALCEVLTFPPELTYLVRPAGQQPLRQHQRRSVVRAESGFGLSSAGTAHHSRTRSEHYSDCQKSLPASRAERPAGRAATHARRNPKPRAPAAYPRVAACLHRSGEVWCLFRRFHEYLLGSQGLLFHMGLSCIPLLLASSSLFPTPLHSWAVPSHLHVCFRVIVVFQINSERGGTVPRKPR